MASRMWDVSFVISRLGSDRSKSEYQAFKQDLEAWHRSLGTDSPGVPVDLAVRFYTSGKPGKQRRRS